MFQFVPLFSYSLKKQAVNPRKVYAIDTGLIRANSGSFTDDTGRTFENLIFLSLRRKHKNIFYFSGKGEFDFVVPEKRKTTKAIQVCHELNDDNLDREINGLFEAMEHFGLTEGEIVTFKQIDTYFKNNLTARIVPSYQFFEEFGG